MTVTLGFVVNPIAGMGGTVGLKGTDGLVDEARRRGAVPRAGDRAREMLALLPRDRVCILTCGGEMGESVLREAGLTPGRVVHEPADPSTAADTRAACRAFVDAGVDLILFCGGDGTARDVVDAVDRRVPVLGIPAGVKMYSGVFATHPATAAEIVGRLGDLPLREAEVMDVDEDAYRTGRLSTRLHGYAAVPYLPERVQGGKCVYESRDEDRARAEIARFIAEIMVPGTLYIIGPGSTTAAIMDEIGEAGTLLGMDLVHGGRVIARDADEQTLLAHLREADRAKIILSPIGAQGFVLGRGNQQISPAVVRAAGPENIIVVATPQKLAHTPRLYIDTGDMACDAAFPDHLQVISGYRMARRVPLVRALPTSGRHT